MDYMVKIQESLKFRVEVEVKDEVEVKVISFEGRRKKGKDMKGSEEK